MREGGSIPVVGLLKNQLGVDTLLLGWGQNDDNLHGPNEKFSPGRLPPRHQGQRPPAGGAGRGIRHERVTPTADPTRVAPSDRVTRPSTVESTAGSKGLSHARPEIRPGQRRGRQAELPRPQRPGRHRSTRSTRSSRWRAERKALAPGGRGGPPPPERGRPGHRQGEGPRPAGRAGRRGEAAQGARSPSNEERAQGGSTPSSSGGSAASPT